jgi:ferredoxin
MMQGIRLFDIRNAIVSSNWIMEVDESQCKGCGQCAKACPAAAIHIEERSADGQIVKRAVREESLCLGCGVCYSACKFNAIHMRSRPSRVMAPETMFDRIVAMAIERGKLADVLFDDPERLSHRALGRVLGAIEKSPPFRAAMAVKPLKSAFLNTLVQGAKRSAGKMDKDIA